MHDRRRHLAQGSLCAGPVIDEFAGDSDLERDGVEAIIVDAAPPLIVYQRELVNLASIETASMSNNPEFAEDGGSTSYGRASTPQRRDKPDLSTRFRRHRSGR